MTRAIIAAAPPLPGWELHATKPPRQWMLAFEVEAEGGAIAIDGTAWEVVVYRYADGLVDIVFRPPPDLGLSTELALLAAIILVDGELGELARLTFVHPVDVVDTWDDRSAPRARRLAPGLLDRLVTAPSHSRVPAAVS